MWKKLGAAQEKAGRLATSLVAIAVASDGALTYRLDRERLRAARTREGRYLLRTNLAADDPELIWRCYRQLCFVEEAFRTLKGDLGLRPIGWNRRRSSTSRCRASCAWWPRTVTPTPPMIGGSVPSRWLAFPCCRS